MNNTLFLFLDRTDPQLEERVRSLSPRIETVSRRQLETRPDLLATIEVAYEGLSREQLSQATTLKWLQVGGAGVNNFLTPEIATSPLLITNVSGIHARCITEHMFGLLLGVTRALYGARESQEKREWKAQGGGVESLYGKTLGILGMGAIGKQAARVGQAFDMRVIGLRNNPQPVEGVAAMFTPDTRLDFFAQIDVVMNVLPLTDTTQGFMGDAEFEALPEGAILINAGRGATIDTGSLLRAMKRGKLKAALLDVTDPEPLPADHALWTTPGVIITAHYSGAHPEYNVEADEIFLDNLQRYLHGEELHHVVDKHAGY